MQNTLFVRELNFSINQVWALLEDFPRLDWLQVPHQLEVFGDGMPGTVRIIKMEGLDEIWEVLIDKDVAQKTISYAVPVGLAVPADNYVATMRLEAISGDRTRLHWHGTWLPKAGQHAGEVRKRFVEVYTKLVDGMEAVLQA